TCPACNRAEVNELANSERSHILGGGAFSHIRPPWDIQFTVTSPLEVGRCVLLIRFAVFFPDDWPTRWSWRWIRRDPVDCSRSGFAGTSRFPSQSTALSASLRTRAS